MKISINIFVILAIASTISCKKQNDKVSFAGSVFEPNTKTNVSDAKVVLSAQLIESGTWNTNFTVLKSVSTDSEGNFKLETESQRVSNYRITISKNNYFENYFNINPENIKNGETYEDNYEIYSSSTININIKNTYPVDSLDKFGYSIDGQLSLCSDCCSGTEKIYTGTTVNETAICKLPGHQTIKINYYYIKGGNTTVKSISKYIPEFETTNVNILY